MPATIACPKCKTKYQLPDSALGKAIKCKKCGAGFRTKAPGAGQAGSKPQQPQKPQPSQKEMAQFGIEGPLKRQADIFASPPPAQRGPNPLGNFVLEDPGFADLATARQEVEEEFGGESGMEAIISNPYASVGGRKKNAKPDVDFSGYNVARIGMTIIYYSWIFMLVSPVLMFLLGLIAFLVPPTIPVIGFIGSIVGGLIMLALVLVFIGQIICIFAPNKNERIYAGLAVGAMVLAFILPIVGFIMGAFASAVVGEEGAGQVAAAAFGIVSLILILSAYILALSNMFFFITYFKKIGQNIRSRELKGAASLALGVWIAAIIVGLLCGIAMLGITYFMRESPGTATRIVSIIGLVNLVLAFAVVCTLLSMVSTAIKRTHST